MNFKKYVKYIPFLIFLIILLCYHWKLAVVTADYPTFQTIVSKHPLLSLTKNGFLSYRYATWSSRSLIEFNVGGIGICSYRNLENIGFSYFYSYCCVIK